MAVQCLSVKSVLDMSGGVSEPGHESGCTEHRAAVCHRFLCVKLGDIVTTARGKLQQGFGEYAVSRAKAFCWHNMFYEGRTLAEDEQRSGRPSATQTGDNTARVRELVRSDRR
jgi:hypothetical protein